MRYVFFPNVLFTIFNIGVLAYWSAMWVRSYRHYKDTVSIIVFLFVFQSLLNEIWIAAAGIYAATGLPMWNITAVGGMANRIVVTCLLAAIHYLVRKMQNEKD